MLISLNLSPEIKATYAKLHNLKGKKECLKQLQNDLSPNGRLNSSGLAPSEHNIVALQDKINNQFDTTWPQVSAFSIFDIVDLPSESDPGFEGHGQNQRYRQPLLWKGGSRLQDCSHNGKTSAMKWPRGRNKCPKSF